MTAPNAAVLLGEQRRYLLVRPTGLAGYLAVVLIALAVATGLVTAWSAWNSYYVFEQFEQGSATVGPDEVVAAEDLWISLVVTDYLVFVLAGIAFITWLYQVRRNAEIFCDAPHRRSGRLVGWSWVVPIVNFWYPFQVVMDIWKASDPATPRRLDSLRTVQASPLLGLWWGFWLASYAVSTLGALVPTRTPLDELLAGAVVITAAEMLTAVAGVLIILCTHRIIRWQAQPRV
ncbi:DUF4328 domain-containing protein [Actinokineospora xionganensis]|uniref:DUF4328 domain-containing protein n=1 Tax=Actinokineospora xionganensis TaxID=2684470 RepID=A0ABR7L185_9PSEU|nr:DUF4328 domain-containing protein [Actinokineospora xionganensis]MBC6446443.1 DUF4328 domain-containing protein [Actinokineospora xionganensis]